MKLSEIKDINRELNNLDIKICSKCELLKYYEDFYESQDSECKDCKLRRKKEYTNKNKERMAMLHRESNKKLYERNKYIPRKRLKMIFSSLISSKVNYMRNKYNKCILENIIPYTTQELRTHLEGLFEFGMTWSNYGKGEGKWEIDHVVPDSWFEYTSVEDEGFKKSWSLESLQPLWSSDNSSKGNRYSGKKDSILEIKVPYDE